MSLRPLIASLLLTAALPCVAQTSPGPDQIKTFTEAIAVMVQMKNFDAIRGLYYLDGTPAPLIDKTMMIWNARVTQPGDPNWTFTGVEYFPLADYLARPGVNKAAIEPYIGERVIDGITYVPTVPVIGFLSVNFQSGDTKNNFLYPVGLTPSGGRLCLVEKKPKE